MNEQAKLFEFEVIRRPKTVEDASPSDAYDFLQWIRFQYRDRCQQLWAEFQKYMGAT